jgi:DNA topoisomerase-1
MPILNAQTLDESVLDEFDLLYISEGDLTIQREPSGDDFIFRDNKGHQISDKKVIERLQMIGVPPAYRNALYCVHDNGHLQAIALDSNNNRQYFYHEQWEILRQKTKFTALADFGAQLPAFRDHIREEMKDDDMHNRVMAAMFRVMDRTGMRVGSEAAAENHDTYGLTTLENTHIDRQGNTIHFEYDGKGGTHISTDICDASLMAIIDECIEIDGQHLFSYQAEDGTTGRVSSSTMNRYLKNQMGHNFTVKDFRTWRFSCIFLKYLWRAIEKGEGSDITLKSLLHNTAQETGNTPAILQSSYIHPGLITIAKSPDKKKDHLQDDPPISYNLRHEERIFLTYLNSNHAVSSLL